MGKFFWYFPLWCESIPVFLKALVFRKQSLEISQRKTSIIWDNSDVESKMVKLVK